MQKTSLDRCCGPPTVFRTKQSLKGTRGLNKYIYIHSNRCIIKICKGKSIEIESDAKNEYSNKNNNQNRHIDKE